MPVSEFVAAMGFIPFAFATKYKNSGAAAWKETVCGLVTNAVPPPQSTVTCTATTELAETLSGTWKLI
jgi:hypothetical protein